VNTIPTPAQTIPAEGTVNMSRPRSHIRVLHLSRIMVRPCADPVKDERLGRATTTARGPSLSSPRQAGSRGTLATSFRCPGGAGARSGPRRSRADSARWCADLRQGRRTRDLRAHAVNAAHGPSARGDPPGSVGSVGRRSRASVVGYYTLVAMSLDVHQVPKPHGPVTPMPLLAEDGDFALRSSYLPCRLHRGPLLTPSPV
jgi:hypothetical protein